ncbi:MAG: PEP/pyruvate-binding domain-containing protein, partial [Bacteroidota bacterium]|nr:PEP/pyruvate-binding domain-containing protein [Bacteroidota bacterium]
STPRITGVSSGSEAIVELNGRHFDLVIIMKGVDDRMPIEVSETVKREFPYIPVYLLLNNNKDIALMEGNGSILSIDKIFVWNGDSKIFFAMIKHLEDKVNVENDTKVGMVRIILLVEDSAKYYSRYLPLLYTSLMEQTKRIIDDVSSDEQHKLLRMRARPKILQVTNYEEAISIFNKYRDYMLCLISDVKFKRNGKLHEEAGFDLIRHIKNELPDLPIIVQSSDIKNQKKAYKLKVFFIDKNSDSLLQDIKSFIRHYLGFGNFIYKDSRGREIAIAKSLREFEKNLSKIPDESILYHGNKNHFSQWLMARGEIKVAKIIQIATVADFNDPGELRKYLLKIIQEYRTESNRGKIIPYEESSVLDETNVTNLADGSLGGKGRGLAFINNLLYDFDLTKFVPGINIRAPRTLVIGTDEFEYFLEKNNLYQQIFSNRSYELVKESFLHAELSDALVKKLKKILKLLCKPIAVRSSGLFEDSLMQPFAGIFETYIIPNNHPDFEVRLKQAMDAIKLVYASVFSKTARGYVEAINYKIEEEKMAIVLQE